jgi:hypothetical protein
MLISFGKTPTDRKNNENKPSASVGLVTNGIYLQSISCNPLPETTPARAGNAKAGTSVLQGWDFLPSGHSYKKFEM